MVTTNVPLLVLMGSGSSADALRSALTDCGQSVVSITTHFRGLRSALATHADLRVILFVTLDHPTLSRHGAALARLMEDYASRSGQIRCVGLLVDAGLAAECATLGCDLYVAHDFACSEQLSNLLESLAGQWRFVETLGPVNRLSAFVAEGEVFADRALFDIRDRKV